MVLKIRHLADPFDYATRGICEVNRGADPGIQIFSPSDQQSEKIWVYSNT